ncbi:carboxypeptidase regulatory-like domain-containing protein [Rubrivirga sp.]|uniref:carboxypeptidase regulatory-like domain-containing protein n=1 Tax=Rubrivirga sp. TaxID=1885344 RepID=UPI003C78CF94
MCLAACDSAPHDNPLDPASGFPQLGAVSGQVTSTRLPFEGRAGVRVRFVPTDDETGMADRSTVTDEAGRFVATGLSAGMYRVVADGDSFRAVTREVEVSSSRTTEVTLRIDSLPVVTSTTARSIRVDSNVAGVESDVLEVTATATDPDGVEEVETATLVVEPLGIRSPLSEISRGLFSGTLEGEDLPGGRLERLLGEALYVEVMDLNGNVVRSAPFGLVRVIDPPPAPVSPTQSVVLNSGAGIVLDWDIRDLPYDYTLDVELIETRGIGPDVILERVTVPSSTTTYTVTETLSRGTYFWTVAYVDEVGNRSRSFESRFEVL